MSPNTLPFRTEEELTQSLADAGFVVERVYNDCDRRPSGARRPES